MNSFLLQLMAICVGFSPLLPGQAFAQTANTGIKARSNSVAKTTAQPDLAAILEETDEAKRMAGMQQAIQFYQRQLTDQPGNSSALHQLGKLYSWTGKTDLAIVTYQSAIKLDSATVLKTDLARIYRWSRRFAEAENLYKAVLLTNPKDHEALKGLSITYLGMGDYGNAQSQLHRALALYPADAEMNKDLGVLHARQQQYPEAIAALEKAISLSPDMIDGYISLGDVYYWNGQYQNALDAYKHALILNPNSQETHVMIAKAYRKLPELSLAKEHAQIVLRMNPVNSDAQELLHEINKQQTTLRIEYSDHYLEFIAQAFFVVLIYINYRKNRRILQQRQRMIAKTILVILPLILLFTVSVFALEEELNKWLDIELYESLANSLLIILLGMIYLTQIRYVGKAGNNQSGNVILAIGAHPDDIELGCGGYILKAKANGAKVYGLTLTKGERGGDNNHRREKEANRSADFMNLDGYWLMDFPDTQLLDKPVEIKEAIEDIIKKTSPTTVLTHNPHDSHGDHRATFVATKEAARMVPTFLCYESVSTPEDFKPDFYVDVTAFLKDMLQAIRLHKTQSEKTYMNPELLTGRAAHRGIQCGVPYASAFKVYRIVE
jgi:LmbE family N-acetylglucosaminyl deacetylase/tetratricopeptide (TPR) repeat protein